VHKNNTLFLLIAYPQQPGVGLGPQPPPKPLEFALEKVKKLPKIWKVLLLPHAGHFIFKPFSFSDMLAFISNFLLQSWQ